MKINIKYPLITLLSINVGTLQAASILVADTSYNMYIRADTSCMQAAEDCRLNVGSGKYTDNNEFVVDLDGNTYGSSIGGDGWAGVVQFTMDATGDNFVVNSFNMDMRETSPPDRFATWADDPSQMTGTIDALGNMTFILRTRMSISGFFISSLGVQPFNFDNSSQNSTPTNDWNILTTGTSSIAEGQLLFDASYETSLTGSALTSDGAGGWNGELVSAGIMGDSLLFFSGTPYTEVWDINIVVANSTVPIPAAFWLFGSGLIGLIGLARRRKHND